VEPEGGVVPEVLALRSISCLSFFCFHVKCGSEEDRMKREWRSGIMAGANLEEEEVEKGEMEHQRVYIVQWRQRWQRDLPSQKCQGETKTPPSRVGILEWVTKIVFYGFGNWGKREGWSANISCGEREVMEEDALQRNPTM